MKNIILWNYKRTSWQYDVLCGLILAFVFLTPRTWFERSEPPAFSSHRNAANRLTIVPVADNFDRADLIEEVKRLTRRDAVRLIEVNEIKDENGNVTAYQVDIE